MVTNWNAAPSTNSAVKISVPKTTRPTVISARDGVQSMPAATAPQASTAAPWRIRPTRRNANRSAHTCTNRLTGRTIIASRLPVLIRLPSRSTLPTTRSAKPRHRAVPPYRKAISASPKPPRTSTFANMTRMPTKSMPVMSSAASVMITNDVR